MPPAIRQVPIPTAAKILYFFLFTFSIYVYGYPEILKPGEKTEPLFRNIRAVNYLEGDLKGDELLKVQVKAQVIQTNVEGKSLSLIYQEFLKQEQTDQKGESYV